MAFDGIVTAAVAKELNDILALGKIEKVYQPASDELLFHIHTKNGNRRLYMTCASNHPRVHFVDNAPENPPVPSRFCMLLRKHLQGGRIVSVEQKDSERIIEIHLETLDELGFSLNKRLIIEIMGKHSNIVLVDSNTEKIIDSIKRLSIDVSRVRQVLPGKEYTYPPSQGKIPFMTVDKSDIEEMFDKGENISENCDTAAKTLLDGIQGISPVIARQLAAAGMSGASIDAAAVCDALDDIKNKIAAKDITPAVYEKEPGSPADFHVVPIDEYQGAYGLLRFETVSQAIDYFYSHRDSSNRLKQKSADLKKNVKNQLKKLYLKKKRLGEDLIKAQNADEYRLFGELITANLHQIHTGDKEVTLTNYYDGKPVTIPLDVRYAPAKNAQLYFKKYGKEKTALKEKKIQLDENDRDIEYLESVSSYIDNASEINEIDALRNELIESGFIRRRPSKTPEKKSSLKPHEYATSDGFRVLAGRNNKENDRLTMKTAGPKDWWFHTKDIPGSHIILFAEGRELTETAIMEAASIAAWHSKGRESENVPVDYTQVRYVKKPNGARPGMVIFTDNRTVYVTPRIPEKE